MTTLQFLLKLRDHSAAESTKADSALFCLSFLFNILNKQTQNNYKTTTSMKQLVWFFYALFLTVLLIWSCTDPTTIGIDLLDDDQAEIGFTDTLSLKATILAGDTTLTYFPVATSSQAFTSYLFGDFEDPIFGNAISSIYAHATPIVLKPDVTNTVIDSVVLVLPYDTVATYGNLDETYGLSVYRVTEAINDDTTYYSNASFQTNNTPLGSIEFKPDLKDKRVLDYTAGTDTLTFKQLRVPLSNSFGTELFQLDTSFYRTDSLFLSYLNGIHIVPTRKTKGMLSFNLLRSVDGLRRGGIYVYYRKDTTRLQMQLEFDPFRARVMSFQHDYNNAPVEQFISKQSGDSLIFVQGMGGTKVRLEIPNAQGLKGLVINKAELELRIASLPEDNSTLYKPINQLLLLAPNTNGDFVVIDDISLITNRGGNSQTLIDLYGGVPLDGKPGEPDLYRINMTAHFQDVIDGLKSNMLELSLFNRSERASRVALFGTKQPQYSIKLKIAYTKL